MKKTIDCKVYNTDTATVIATDDNGYYPNDFNYCSETLYQTQKGAFFIAGEGGPLSRYRRKVGSMSYSGHGLEVLSSSEALNWLEKHERQNEIDMYFSEQIEEA